jgi:hypothetical protein
MLTILLYGHFRHPIAVVRNKGRRRTWYFWPSIASVKRLRNLFRLSDYVFFIQVTVPGGHIWQRAKLEYQRRFSLGLSNTNKVLLTTQESGQ